MKFTGYIGGYNYIVATAKKTKDEEQNSEGRRGVSKVF